MNLLADYRAGLAGLDRRARLVALGSALFIASRMSTVTFLGIFFVEERGLSAALVGAALFAESLARGIAAPFMGALSDRLGRRPLLLGHILATAILLPAFLLVEGPLTLFAWSVMVGLAQGPYFSLSSSLLLDLVPVERRQSALSVNYTAISVGFTLGVAPAGFLAESGYEWLALTSFLGALSVAALYATMLRGPFPREASTMPRTSMARETFDALRDRAFLKFALLAAVFPLGIGLVTVPIALYASESGVARGTIGLILSLNGAILILLAVPVNARLEAGGPRRLLPLSAALCGLSYVGLAFTGAVPALLANAVLFSMGEVLFASAVPTVVASLAPPGRRGAYQGAWGLVFATGVGFAVLLAGVGRDVFGWGATWALAALVTGLAGVGLTRRVKARAAPP